MHDTTKQRTIEDIMKSAAQLKQDLDNRLAAKQNLSPVTKASGELLSMMNEAIANEMQVSIQYMWQHVTWSGIKGYAFNEELKSIAIAEMKHAEAIAERLSYLGEIPTTKPTPITIGDTLQEMIDLDEQAERQTINLYKKIIQKALDEKDETTARLFTEILADEENHHDTFVSILEDL